ncbi:hypothetical protein BHE74_00051342 [Ensete ventricosum]|nr:hypothetical protein BHE74_00051342 [Ensete ventricosum]
MHRVDAVGNLPGVRRELAEGIGSLSGWPKGVRQKKTETRQKIVGAGNKLTGSYNDDEIRSSLSIGPGFGRCSGISLEFAKRFTEGIRKLARNISGDYRKKIIGRKATGLAGVMS